MCVCLRLVGRVEGMHSAPAELPHPPVGVGAPSVHARQPCFAQKCHGQVSLSLSLNRFNFCCVGQAPFFWFELRGILMIVCGRG